MSKRKNDHANYESEIMKLVGFYWGVRTNYVGNPYYGGYCLVDHAGRVLAWVQLFDRQDQSGIGFTFDVRRLTEVSPIIWTSGKKLVLVVRSGSKLQYVVWKPGIAEYRPCISENDQQLAYEYWDAVISWDHFKPVTRNLPREVVTTSRKPTGRRGRGTHFKPLFELKPRPESNA